MSEASPLARGSIVESATLTESPFLIGRIAISDPSPNKVSVRLARDFNARALSVAGP